jgi:hypothetical protein
MYTTRSGDAIFVIDGHAQGQAPATHDDSLRAAIEAGELDMSVRDVAPGEGADPGISQERLIRTGLCLPDAEGRPAWSQTALEQMRREWGIRGITIVPPERPVDARVYHLYTPEGFAYLAACERLGVCNVHLFPGALRVAGEQAPYEVEDLERAASSFPGLNFIVEHGGLPWFEDFCWIATKELNVYAGLGQLMPFLLSKPRYFAEMLAELLFWLGPDRLIFGSDWDTWAPRALVEEFMRFELPPDLCAEYRIGLSLEVKRQILGENLAHLYRVKIPR